MWKEGIEMAKTAYALEEAIESGDTGRIIELGELLAREVKDEVGSQAEAGGWYEEYDRATSAKAESKPPAFIFDRDLIEGGLEQCVIRVFPEDDVDIRVSIGENWFWAKMPEELGPHADRHFSDFAACEFTDAVATALADLAENPEDYGDELAYYDAYLRENVDLAPSAPSEPVSLRGEAQASRDAADTLGANDGSRDAVSQQR